jgi:serine/threonine-protein kinase
LASGLQAAHDQNIIHRDISPDNVIVPNSDVAQSKIIDFGIARTTQHGTVIGGGFAGKISYVSPEQVGLFGGDVTAKSDIYSLGLVLVEALNGKSLDMGGSQFEMIEKRRKLPELGAIDMRFRPLLERMLQPDPAKRPESMADVAAWSFTAPTGRRGRTGRKDKPPSEARPARSWLRWQYAASAAVLLALICGSGGAYYFLGLPTWFSSAPTPGNGSPSSPPRNPSTAQPRAEQIRSYIDRYNGGNCFFLSPVAISDNAAAIEGFGASVEPFRAFDTAFRHDMGFEADIGVHEITQPQCPAAAFLAGLRGNNSRPPRLDIDHEDVHNGEVLNGLIDRYGGRQVALILVSDSGTVQNVTGLLKPGTDAKTFKIGMKRVDGITGRQPQLLVAVISSAPLAALAPADAVGAAQFFARVVSEATKANMQLSAAARYFVLEN